MKASAWMTIALGACLVFGGWGCIIIEKEDHVYHDPEAAPLRQSASCPIESASIANTASAPTYSYRGKTYYFCCIQCRDRFEASPDSYCSK